jgi:hypothetical protein
LPIRTQHVDANIRRPGPFDRALDHRAARRYGAGYEPRPWAWRHFHDDTTRPFGGRNWWAHCAFTRIAIELTFQNKKIEDLMNVRGVGERSFLKLKPLITVTPPKTDRAAQD